MSKFESPALVEIEDMAEGVYASSGAPGVIIPVGPTPTATPEPSGPAPTPSPSWTVLWDNHNGGQKSYIRLKGSGHPCSGESITIVLKLLPPASIATVIHEGEADMVLLDTQTIQLTRNNHYNAGNDQINFLVGALTFKTSPGNPAETGSYYDSSCSALHCGEEMDPVTGPFIINSVVYS